MKASPQFWKNSTLSAITVAAVVFAGPADTQSAELMLNGSFESGSWGGTYDFVDNNNATQLYVTPKLLTGWATEGHSVWVNDTSRANHASRFVWLDPSYGSTVCVAQSFNVFSSGDSSAAVVAGADYHVSVDFAFFDQGDVLGTDLGASSLEVYAYLGSRADGFLDPSTRIDLPYHYESGSVSPWSAIGGGNGLNWNTADIHFTMPDVTGYDYMTIFFSAPLDTVGTPSRGVALDNVSFAAIPEPSAALLAMAFGMTVGVRRRR